LFPNISNSLLISKRRRKVKNESSKGKNSKDREKIPSKILNVGSHKVGILDNVGYGNVRSLHKRHLGGLGAGVESTAGDCRKDESEIRR
jgi:hypothetical protein